MGINKLSNSSSAKSLNVSGTESPDTPRFKQRLLHKHHDCECSWLEKLYIRYFLRNDTAGVQYLADLKEVSEALKVTLDGYSSKTSNDFWQRVDKRISQEQRFQAVDTLSKEDRQQGLLLWLSRLGWGLSGAFATATLVVLYNPILQQNMLATTQNGQLSQTGASTKFLASTSTGHGYPELRNDSINVRNVNDSPSGSSREAIEERLNKLSLVSPRNKRLRSPFDIDWMKSDGRVHVIQDASERSMIFWIKKGKLTSEFVELDQDAMYPHEVDK